MLKVSYFGVPGRGESVRLMCALAGLEFTDDKFDPKAWVATRKGAARFRMTPTVEGLPGVASEAGQSRALVRFLGKMAVGEDGATPLYPTDAVDALRADEICDYVEDIWGKLLEARAAKAVAAALAPSTGGVAAMLDVLEHSLPAAGAGGVGGGGGGFAVGSATSTADVFLFAALGWWATPFFKGSTLDALLAGRPKLRAVAERVGALPAVRAFYAGRDFKAPQHQLWAVYGHLAKL